MPSLAQIVRRAAHSKPTGRGGYRPGAGRPPKPETEKAPRREQINLRLPHEMAEDLRQMAATAGVTISELIRELLRNGLEQQ